MTDAPLIYWHADDYGMTPSSDRRILECRTHGCLNSVSIVPNGDLSGAMAYLKDSGLFLAVHLNLVEGKSLSPAKDVPLLVHPDGSFKNSFGGLLKLSISPKRKEFAAQVRQELRAQLLAFATEPPSGAALRVDSHQHVHMIPLIFHILLSIIEEEQLPVSHLRIPAEPMTPFLRQFSLWRTYKLINVIKQVVLNGCWLLVKPAFDRSGISTSVFCGILFSGQMDAERVSRVLPAFYRIAQRRGQSLELLFHPGAILPGEPFFDPEKHDFHPFYRSNGRMMEAQALQTLHFPPVTRKGEDVHHGNY